MTISIVIVDDHPAVRAGLRSLLDDEPDLRVLATATSSRDGFSAIADLQPAVAIVDYHLPDEDGFSLCLRTRTLPQAPRFILYSAFASTRLAILAVVAGAATLISKNSAPHELLAAIRADDRSAGGGERMTAEALQEAGARLDPDDLPILGMLAHGIPPVEIAATLSMDERWLRARRWAMLERLRRTPSQRPADRAAFATAHPSHTARGRLV